MIVTLITDVEKAFKKEHSSENMLRHFKWTVLFSVLLFLLDASLVFVIKVRELLCLFAMYS